MTFPTQPNPPPDPPPEYRSPDGLIRLHCDAADEVYYIEVSPGYAPSERRAALRRAAGLGLQPLHAFDDQEDDARPPDEGTTRRIWLAEIAEPAPPPGT